jgi:hypothetical protein
MIRGQNAVVVILLENAQHPDQVHVALIDAHFLIVRHPSGRSKSKLM